MRKTKTRIIRDLFVAKGTISTGEIATALIDAGHKVGLRTVRADLANARYYCDFRTASDRQGNFTLTSVPLPDHVHRCKDDGYFVVSLKGHYKWSGRYRTRKEAEEYLATVQAREAKCQPPDDVAARQQLIRESGLCAAMKV